MSFQFEDESALEELLNQQLEKRRQPPQFTPVAPPATKQNEPTGRPSTGVLSSVRSAEFPSRAATSTSLVRSTLGSRQDNSGNEKGKLASWLDKGAKEPELPTRGQSEVRMEVPPVSSIPVRKKPTLRETPAIEELVDEDALQSMSKQRLIQYIQQELVPAFNKLKQTSGVDSNLATELTELQSELASAKSQLNLIELRHAEQEKLIESKWAQINDSLRSRLETNERELTSTIERQQQHLDQVTKDHQQQLAKLQENYQLKVAEERRLNEEIVKRREEFHRLEMESKLKVNFDLVNLETVFGEWHNMMHSTIEDLNRQFKSVESLLDKQAIRVANTNKELESKSQLVVEQQQKFDTKTDHISQVARKLDEILPKVVEFQQANDKWAVETKAQTNELNNRLAELRTREDQLRSQSDELRANKEALGEEKMEIRIEMNKLTLKAEQLEHLEAKLTVTEQGLSDKSKSLSERESQLEAIRLNQEIKTSELKQLNNELLYTRRKLSLREAQVQQQKIELANERRSLKAQSGKLDELRSSVRKESNQLKRLQHSLVCSICFDRLFSPSKTAPSTMQNKLMSRDTFKPTTGTLKSKELRDYNQDLVSDNNNPEDDELTKLSRCVELDVARLKRENKYVEFISTQS